MTQAAIVTGAGSGIGRAAALQLAEAGWAVTLVGRTEAKLRQTAAAIGDERRVLVHAADLVDSDACGAVVTAAVERFGRLDALINCAGYAAVASIAQTTDAIWRQSLDANLSATFYLTRAAMPALAQQGGGFVGNVSSMAAFDPFPGFAAYAPAKAAVNMLTLITAREGAAVGVAALAVAPGAVETPMLRGLFDASVIPPGKTLDPADVAAVLTAAALGQRDFISGSVVELPSPA